MGFKWKSIITFGIKSSNLTDKDYKKTYENYLWLIRS